MDPNNPPLPVLTADGVYHGSVASSGYPDQVTSSGYPNQVTSSGDPSYPVALSSYYDNSVYATDLPPMDVAALLASNAELTARIENMRLEYNGAVQSEMQTFQASLQDDFTAIRIQRDAARNESQLLTVQMAATIARLESIERAQNAPPATPQRTRDPRVRPGSSATTTAANPTRANAQKARAKQAPATPQPAQPSRPSKSPGGSSMPNNSDRRRSSKPEPEAAPASTPRRSSPKQRDSSSDASSSQKSANKEKTGGEGESGTKAKSSASGGANGGAKGGAKGGVKGGAKGGAKGRKLAEHQMLKGDIDPEAQSLKMTFQTHLAFLGGHLDPTQAPVSADAATVRDFELRLGGLTVAELKRLGQLGHPVINPRDVKVGISVEEGIRSKSRIVRAFFQIEESALLHIKSYLAKLGITKWAVDYTQSPYSMYNMGMRMAAIDTFRFCVAGTYYDFLRPNTSYINDSHLLQRLYDHYIHRYLSDKWKVEIRAPGSNVTNAERNKLSQARIRLHGSRAKYIAAAKIPEGLKLMFQPKATSDDESTPTGSQALARPERSQVADQVIRALDGLILEDLLSDGKTRSARNRERRRVPLFGQRGAGYFQEIPKGMPIQYYDSAWFNNRPPQARAKIAPKLIVVVVPGSVEFFSRRGDNVLSVAELTEKYGPAVFEKYDLDFGPNDAAEESTEGARGADADDEEGEGDSIGSQDSEEDMELSDAGSVASFLEDDGASDDEQDYEEGMDDQQDTASGEEDAMARFAAVYDIDMNRLDDEQEIFGDGDSPDSDN